MTSKLVATLVAAFVLLTAFLAQYAGAGTITVPSRSDATAVPPLVGFEVRDGAGSRARSAGNDDATLPSIAVLDTGASAHLLSHDTAALLGVRADAGARWTETGMNGEHPFGVSSPCALALAATPPLVLPTQRVLLNDVAATADAILASPGAVVDVIGMPAIERVIVEMRPSARDGGGLDLAGALAALAPSEVTILRPDRVVAAEQWLPLVLRDFSRRTDPRNRGAAPTLARNPVLPGVRVVRGSHAVGGDWLLDTGSAVTIVSTATARALGFTGAGPLSVPLGGISGNQEAMSGWRVDRIELATTTGSTLAITDAAVFVHDVTTTTDDGARTTLDGILGSNILDAFARAVLDVPHARLGVDLRPPVRTPDSRRR